MKLVFSMVLAVIALGGCSDQPSTPRLGISFGVGEARRWPYEMQVMVERAKEMGLQVDARLNKNQAAMTQIEDCEDMIRQGVSALIVVPRDAGSMKEILRKARARDIKVIAYARAIHDAEFDFYVGYDTYRIGRSLGTSLVERVSRGDIALLKGDPADINSPALHGGVMRSIKPYVDGGDVNIVLDEYVENWQPETAKAILRRAIEENHGRIDGVLAQNDILAGAAAEVIDEMRLGNPVAIVGMDAELPALRRLVRGRQASTIHMDLKTMSTIAVDAADSLIRRQPAPANAEFVSLSGRRSDAYLVNGRIITKENLDRQIIEPGIYTREEIYGD